MFEWNKKEAPIKALAGLGGGVGRNTSPSGPLDTGNGGGFTVAQGAYNGTGTHTSTSTVYFVSSFYASAGAGGGIFNYNHTGSFCMHTGHNGNSSQWPLYLAFQVTTHAQGRVLDVVDWKKHSNACGNTDIWGSNQAITSSNFTNTALYSYLGRVNFGGSGSASDYNVTGGSFNTNQWGYRFYMMQVQDISGPLAYPNVGTLNGWAMYGQRWRKS